MIKSEIFLWFCLCFILGIFLFSFLSLSPIFLQAFLFLGFFSIFLSLFLKNKKMRFVGFCFLFLFLGSWRYSVCANRANRQDLKPFFGKKQSLIAYVIEEPEKRISNTKIKINIPDLQANALITFRSYPELQYGDKILVNGILKEPPEFEDFDYKDYLKKQGIYFLISYPKIKLLKKSKGFSIKKLSISFKQKLRQSLERIVPFQESGFFEALIWGGEENVSQEWKEKLNISGVRHIAAVSGANITILTGMLLNFLLFLGLWRRQAFWASLFLIFFYILMIGAPACGVRAGIMACLFLFSQQCGRISDPERLLVFALTLMLVFNPLLLKSDIGFQLSFLAVLGLIYFSPLFLKIFRNIPDSLSLRTNLASTLGAQIFVLPILIYNFGRVSLVSPLTNILVLPSITILTIGGFLFSLIGIISFPLAKIISFPFQILLGIEMKIIDICSQFSFASKQVNVSFLFVLISYIVLFAFARYLKNKQRLSFLDY